MAIGMYGGKIIEGRVKYATCFKRASILFKLIQLFAEDPQKCHTFYISALTNHSFGAESLVKPQLHVFSNVLGVQNLQIHVLVNGFQGALVLHS